MTVAKRANAKPLAPPLEEEVTAILRRRAALLAQPLRDAAVEMGTSVLTFSRGGRLAVDAERVREVSPVRTVEPLPDQPAFVAGLVAWRGRPVLAIDPAALLAKAVSDRPAYQIVLGLQRGDVALLADDIRGVAGMLGDALDPAPAGPTGLEGFAAGYSEAIGLLIDADLLEASLLELSAQSQEVRP